MGVALKRLWSGRGAAISPQLLSRFLLGREATFAFQYQVPPKMFMGEKSPVRIILLVVPVKSYGPAGPK